MSTLRDRMKANRLYLTIDQTADLIEENYIVIDREDLPKVERDAGGHLRIEGGTYSASGTPEGYRAYALRSLAAAAHLEANPPIDQEQVDAILKAVNSAGNFRLIRQGAEELYRAGVRVP